MIVWVRTCQECGHKQSDKEPKGDVSSAYRNRKCKKCKSEALDYGTYPSYAAGERDE
jgi:hypothetical protein